MSEKEILEDVERAVGELSKDSCRQRTVESADLARLPPAVTERLEGTGLIADAATARRQVRVKIIRGHRVASGRAGDPRFPGGTIHLQMPHFKALGLDLSPYFPGTINVSVAPLSYAVVKPALTFERVKWIDSMPAETFSFFNVWRVRDDGSRIKGLVYYPHPETKVEHFQSPDTLELLFPKMDDVAYGQELLIELNPAELSVA